MITLLLQVSRASEFLFTFHLGTFLIFLQILNWSWDSWSNSNFAFATYWSRSQNLNFSRFVVFPWHTLLDFNCNYKWNRLNYRDGNTGFIPLSNIYLRNRRCLSYKLILQTFCCKFWPDVHYHNIYFGSLTQAIPHHFVWIFVRLVSMLSVALWSLSVMNDPCWHMNQYSVGKWIRCSVFKRCSADWILL